VKRRDEQYAADYAVIEQDLTEAQELEFGAYCGFMADYGIKLRELAAKHSFPDGAFMHLRTYADDFLDRLNAEE
jgi:hypothetical protein